MASELFIIEQGLSALHILSPVLFGAIYLQLFKSRKSRWFTTVEGGMEASSSLNCEPTECVPPDSKVDIPNVSTTYIKTTKLSQGDYSGTIHIIYNDKFHIIPINKKHSRVDIITTVNKPDEIVALPTRRYPLRQR